MYFFHILPFIWLGLTDYCSSQWANLDAQLEDEFPPSAPQNRLNVDSRIVFDPIDYGARVSRPESNSPEVPIANQAEIIQACPYNSYELSPTKRRLKREWCRDDGLAPNDSPVTTNPKPPSSSVQEDRPKDGSEAGQLEGGEKTPSTNINPQLPSVPGREQLPGQHDSNPCNEAGINPVCSPFYVSQVFYPLSLVWKATWLEFCRICTSTSCVAKAISLHTFFFPRKKKEDDPTHSCIAQIIRDKGVSRKPERNFTVAMKSEMR